MLPAATGLGEPASVTLKSALDRTFAVSVDVFLKGSIAPPPLTTAVLISVAGAVCKTFAVMVIDG